MGRLVTFPISLLSFTLIVTVSILLCSGIAASGDITYFEAAPMDTNEGLPPGTVGGGSR